MSTIDIIPVVFVTGVFSLLIGKMLLQYVKANRA
jgi:hypothetical protein